MAGKTALYLESEESVEKLKAAADVLVAMELKGLKGKKYEEALESAADYMMLNWATGTQQLLEFAKALRRTQDASLATRISGDL